MKNRYLLILFFILSCLGNVLAQDSLATPEHSPLPAAVAPSVVPVATKLPLMSIDFGVDYLKLASFAFKNNLKYEGLAAINFRFGLSLDGEYGYGKITPNHIYKNGTYTSEGNYYRIGFGYNIPIGERNSIGLGLRYAQSEYKDSTYFTIKTIIPGERDYMEGKGHQAKVNWIEVVLKSEGSLKKVKNIKLGMFLRFKSKGVGAENENFPTLNIPGYGIAKAKYTASVNLYIKYSIPLFK